MRIKDALKPMLICFLYPMRMTTTIKGDIEGSQRDDHDHEHNVSVRPTKFNVYQAKRYLSWWIKVNTVFLTWYDHKHYVSVRSIVTYFARLKGVPFF